MKKVIIIGLLFLSYCSSPQRSHYFELPVLKKIAQLSLVDPPPAVVSFTPVYVIGLNDSISESRFIELQAVYKSTYTNRYTEFSDFLFAALNQEIKLDTKNPTVNLYYSQTFMCNQNITRLYQEKGLKGIMDKHCLNNNGLYILNREALTLNEINSISYYFFINQYIRTDDDYSATINFKQLSTVIK